MLSFKEYMPTLPNEPFTAKTKYGLRTVVYDLNHQMFRYTDCTHPMQNMYCNPYEIEEWEYIDKSKMEQLCFIDSWIGKAERERNGHEILESIKPTFFERFLNLFRQKDK